MLKSPYTGIIKKHFYSKLKMLSSLTKLFLELHVLGSPNVKQFHWRLDHYRNVNFQHLKKSYYKRDIKKNPLLNFTRKIVLNYLSATLFKRSFSFTAFNLVAAKSQQRILIMNSRCSISVMIKKLQKKVLHEHNRK